MVCRGKGYYVGLFGIVDDFLNENGRQCNFVSGEGTKYGSNEVSSILHHFSVISVAFGRVRMLHLHRDSCAEHNKNNIVLGYILTRVRPGYHDDINWHFLTVSHTKLRPGEFFGNIRNYVCERF